MRKRGEIIRHRSIFLLLATAILLSGAFVWRNLYRDTVGPVRFICGQEGLRQYPAAPSLPETQYLISENYGWFDQSHFNTGRPAEIIAAVQTAIDGGADTFIIRQGVRNNVTGYSAVYWVSSQAQQADVLSIALGIYYDWSIRFETWESQMPRWFAAPFSPFAVEDLPSHYLGFFAKSHQMTIEEVFACYLGPVTGSDEGPPELVLPDDTVTTTDTGIVRLENRSFTPMVETSNGWQQVNWPKSLRMNSVTSSFNTWRYLSDETWYLDDSDANLHLLNTALTQYRVAPAE